MTVVINNRLDLLAWTKHATKHWWEMGEYDCLWITEGLASNENRPNYSEDWSEYLSKQNLFQVLEDTKNGN